MWQQLVVKYAITAALVVLVNEVVIRYSKEWLGSLIASLPLVSVITFFWIYYGIAEPAERTSKLANHSTGVFWFVLPSLPMFLLFPFLLKKGITFWPAMLLCCAMTMLLYYGMVLALKKFGVAF
jgi:hypothetical protein